MGRPTPPEMAKSASPKMSDVAAASEDVDRNIPQASVDTTGPRRRQLAKRVITIALGVAMFAFFMLMPEVVG